MANLFGKNRLRETAQQIKTDDIHEFIAIIQTWHSDYHIGTLKLDKETSREQAYNQDFFIKILGYKEKPAVPYSLEPKATTEKSQFPDAVISYTDKPNGTKNIAAVVELKGASVELDRPQRREGNISPIQQGFKYKTQYRNCPFVIVSNFWEFRLYHDNLLDYELWTLDDLVNPTDDYLLFKTWYVLLCRNNFTTSKGTSKTENLLSDIRIVQEEIGKKFYKVYKQARLDLLRDIYKRNSQIKSDIDTGIEKAQKIIDRIVFACFAEDKGLLPDDTLHRVVQAADSSAFGGSLWNTLKGFFEAIDIGSDKLEIPNGYNGGLFAHDDALNNLQISDEPLRAVVNLSSYNFTEDLSVRILGHIFEQSISDLEEIKNKVNESQNLETLNQSRRKKDGIFYTPDYIVRYIVENSLGAYLHEHEEMFKTEFKLHGDITDKNYEKREKQAYAKYQDFLQNVKVVDPACGSGAFLVYVFDYLLAENKRVGDILGNTLFTGEEYIKSILQNNIYGVDLNEESVEITKLSLWLKSAQKGKKLTALDNNIKCGNSLINDPEVAGNKAFDWQKEFADIFKNGGFDVIVGNPPWGADIPALISGYMRSIYPVIEKQVEIYIAFLSKGMQIIRPSGFAAYITPSTWLTMHYYKKLRRLVLDNTKVDKAVLITYQAFEDVTAETAIVVLRKDDDYTASIKTAVAYETKDFGKLNYKNVNQSFWSEHYLEGFNLYFDSKKLGIIKKLFSNNRLGDYIDIKNGMKPYCVNKGIPVHTKEIVENRIYDSDYKKDETYKNYIMGKNIHRFWIEPSSQWIAYGDNLAEPRGFNFEQPKIVVRQTGDRIISSYDGNNFYNLNNVHNLLANKSSNFDLRVIPAILNSKVVNFAYNYLVPEAGRVFAEVKAVNLKKLPIPDLEDTAELTKLSIEIGRDSLKQSKIIERFNKLISSEFNLEKWPTKLNKWWRVDFADFVAALKLKLSLQQKDELLTLFEKYRTECTALDIQIQKTDQEINHQVYKLYNLTPEEIATVEGV